MQIRKLYNSRCKKYKGTLWRSANFTLLIKTHFMENNSNRNYEDEHRNSNSENKTYATNPDAKKAQERTDNSDDFHKYDDLSHRQDGERLERKDGERIDRSGTDPNCYANLASQDTGSNKSMYNNEDRVTVNANYPNEGTEDDDYDADDISDAEFSDEEEELRNNETNSFNRTTDSEQKNSSPDAPFFSEGI